MRSSILFIACFCVALPACDVFEPLKRVPLPESALPFSFAPASPTDIWALNRDDVFHYDGSGWTRVDVVSPVFGAALTGARIAVLDGSGVSVLALDGTSTSLDSTLVDGSMITIGDSIFVAGPYPDDAVNGTTPVRRSINGGPLEHLTDGPGRVELLPSRSAELLNAVGGPTSRLVYDGQQWLPVSDEGIGSGADVALARPDLGYVSIGGDLGKEPANVDVRVWDGSVWSTVQARINGTGDEAINRLILQRVIPGTDRFTLVGTDAYKRGNASEQRLSLFSYDFSDVALAAGSTLEGSGARLLATVDDPCQPFCQAQTSGIRFFGERGVFFEDTLGNLYIGEAP